MVPTAVCLVNVTTEHFCRQCALPVPQGVEECAACRRYFAVSPDVVVEDPIEAEARSEDPLMRGLLKGACALWLLSLALPAFTTTYRPEPFPGWGCLLAGLLFGWAVNGWAAYANLFFWRVAFQLFDGQRPVFTPWLMGLLAASAVFFRGPIQDEGSMAIDPLASWGWGAVVWGCALALMASAAARRASKIERTGVIAIISSLVVVALALAALGRYQSRALNVQEREEYLPSGMAFTLIEPCGVALNWPERAVIDPGSVVALDLDEEFERRFDVPKPWTYIEDGYAWTRYGTPPQVVLEVASAMRAPDTKVIARRTESGGDISIQEVRSGRTLYRQEYRAVRSVQGRRALCPRSTGGSFDSIEKGTDAALARALGTSEVRPTEIAFGLSEVAQESCDPKVEQTGTEDKRWLLDGRLFRFPPSSRGLCSPSYVALYDLSLYEARRAQGRGMVVLLDRATLQPISRFAVHLEGESLGPTRSRAFRGVVAQINIGEDAVTFVTSEGNVVAPRVETSGSKPN